MVDNSYSAMTFMLSNLFFFKHLNYATHETISTRNMFHPDAKKGMAAIYFEDGNYI